MLLDQAGEFFWVPVLAMGCAVGIYAAWYNAIEWYFGSGLEGLVWIKRVMAGS
ncbi:uncharacterized protein BKA55DRAFT_569469 [Fusarium redolens]|uniref:Uncharacterized protein n=1 Tax=Fusarium redolens TaxID=48865 RepID=A0A9P9H0Q9_FUSRE|nr:uncharacterized protein BKA55DRAFT_569469 [Fusarium redolens]KAH7248571.1 hypothetical protein BKA55DRAFT_569469 [Fusarium redolens]